MMGAWEATVNLSGLDVAELKADDERFIARSENLFVFLRGCETSCRLIAGSEEVFGRPLTRFSSMRFNPTDFLGHACHHCRKSMEDLDDLVIWIRMGKTGGLLHETCFRKWFVSQDKAELTPYRFACLRKTRLQTSSLHHQYRVGDDDVLEGVEVDLLAPFGFSQIAESSEEAEAAREVQAVHREGRTSETNILFCPRCDCPVKVSFLDTVGVHGCPKCSARFRVRIEELP